MYLPLQRALSEIGRRNSIRSGVADVLSPENRRVVQYSLDHTPRGTLLRVVVVGDATTASEVEGELRERLGSLHVDDLQLTVWAVPDAATLSSLTKRVDAIPPPPPTPPPPEPAPVTARRHDSDAVEAIRRAWPSSGTGPIVAIWRDLDHPQRVRVVHLGSPIGLAGIHLLGVAVAGVDRLELEEDALLPVEAPRSEGQQWLPRALDLVARTRTVGGIELCVTVPERVRVGKRPVKEEPDPVRVTIESVFDDPGTRVITAGEVWRIIPQQGPCAVSPPVTDSNPNN